MGASLLFLCAIVVLVPLTLFVIRTVVTVRVGMHSFEPMLEKRIKNHLSVVADAFRVQLPDRLPSSFAGGMIAIQYSITIAAQRHRHPTQSISTTFKVLSPESSLHAMDHIWEVRDL